MRDLTGIPQNLRGYGGLSCLKIGLTIGSKNYLVKFPGNLKSKDLKNVQLSYSNGPICEYLGSQIFELFGMPTHKTELATRDNKLVVMCEDFITSNIRLIEFRELKATYEPAFMNTDGELTDGMGSDLDEALLVIRKHPISQHTPTLEHFFWKMFIIDALIGNPDRNNGNWGLLVENDTNVMIAPVYDNGNCLNDKWDEDKMQKFLSDEQLILQEAYKGKVCFFTRNGKRLNPFQIIESNEFPICTEVLYELFNSVEFTHILQLLENTQLTKIQHNFYKTLLSTRFERLKILSQQVISKVNSF